jgi:hypothetical protein
VVFTDQHREFVNLRFERGLVAFAILEAQVELSFAQGEHVRADFEVVFGVSGAAGVSAKFLRSTSAALVEGLHPEGLGDVGDGFGEAMKGGGAGVEARG